MFTSFMTNPRTMNNPLREWWLKSITETIRNMSDKQEAERGGKKTKQALYYNVCCPIESGRPG